MKKILVVRYRFIGDTLLTVPFLRNLRRANPDAQIDVLVSPVSGDVLKSCPYIDNLIYFDNAKKHRYEQNGSETKGFWRYVKLLKEKKYDKAYVLKRSLSSAFLIFLAGIKERVGFNTECRGFLLTKRVPYTADKHEIDSFLDVLEYDGIEVKDNYLENWLLKEDEEKIDKIIAENPQRPKIQIHATSGNPGKQWPLEYFAQIVEHLINQKECLIYYVGAKSDEAVYNEIRKLIKNSLKSEPINLCGKLSITESTCLTKKMDLLIGNDSGNLHISSSLNIPTIGIYGPMSTKKWGLRGENDVCLMTDLNCYPCGLRTKCKSEKACLYSITPDAVLKTAEQILTKKSKEIIFVELKK